MKKALAMVLVIVMAVFTLLSCGAPAVSESQDVSDGPELDQKETQSASEPDGEQSPANSGDAAAGRKIGVIFYGKDDSLGQAVYATLNHAAEALGIEITWKLGDLDPTAQITAAENMVAAGVDGILCIPMSEVVTQKVAKLCQDNGVYYANCFRYVNDETIRNEVEAYEYFLGGCYEDEVAAAKHVVELMAQAGKKNAGMVYVSPGNALESRNFGLDDGIEAYGINKLGEYTIAASPDLNALTSTIQNFVNSYPDMDVILSASSSVGQGEAAVNTLSTIAPDGKVQLATFDVFNGMKEAFANKSLALCVGGMSPDALMSFMLLYNAVAGQRLSDDVVWLNQNYIYVTDEASCEGYEKYIDNPEYMIYTAEDIQSMSKVHNPEFTLDELKQIMSEYTMENVMAKAEGKE